MGSKEPQPCPIVRGLHLPTSPPPPKVPSTTPKQLTLSLVPEPLTWIGYQGGRMFVVFEHLGSYWVTYHGDKVPEGPYTKTQAIKKASYYASESV